MITYTWARNEAEAQSGISRTAVTVSLDNEANIDEAIAAFAKFLMAVGYSVELVRARRGQGEGGAAVMRWLLLLPLPALAQAPAVPLYWQAFGLVQTCVAAGACPAWVDVDDEWRKVTVGQGTFACVQDRSDPKRRAVIGAPTATVDKLLQGDVNVLLDLTNPMLRQPAPSEALLECFPDWKFP